MSMDRTTLQRVNGCVEVHFQQEPQGYSRRVQGTDQPAAAPVRVSAASWTVLLALVQTEIAEAIELTLERTHMMHSYDGVPIDVRRELATRSYQAILIDLQTRQRPEANADGTVFDLAGEACGRDGVAIREML